MSASAVPPTKAWKTNGPSSNASHGTVPVIAYATTAPNVEPVTRNTSSAAVSGTSTATAQ